MNHELRQFNVRFQDVLNRLTRIESRLTRFGEAVGVDMDLVFEEEPRDPIAYPWLTDDASANAADLLEALLKRTAQIEFQLCRAMDYNGVSPQRPQRAPRKMNALRHHQRAHGG